MDMEKVVSKALRTVLGISAKEARAIMEGSKEVAKKETQALMGLLRARKFRRAASLLIKLMKKVLSPKFGFKLLQKGVVGAEVTILLSALRGKAPKLSARLIEIFKKDIPPPRQPRPVKKAVPPKAPKPGPTTSAM